MTPRPGADRDPSSVAHAWAVLASARLSPSSDELALLATWEAMRLMLIDDRERVQRAGREGIRGLLQVTIEALRDTDPEALDRLVEKWRPEATAMGLEW
jgi:hypothetical protein